MGSPGSNGDGQAALPEYGSRYSRRDDTQARNAQALPTPLYHQRWPAESDFSQHKHRLGSCLTARRDDAQGRALVLRVLIHHNLMLLAEAA
ncbi:hypothetical protein GCM10011504_39860 [Siccirubricoccus deserti]|nr:hypothetical protein GCM10011504_39860 [Siccirubricoccus deserti]